MELVSICYILYARLIALANDRNWWYHAPVNRFVKPCAHILWVAVIIGTVAGIAAAPASAATSSHAERIGAAAAARSEASVEISGLHPPDPNKELRQLSKNLKLKKGQRVGVSSILQERAREIQLLLDVESLSQDYRTVLAAKVMHESNAQIETLLKNNQKRKFDKELARDHEAL